MDEKEGFRSGARFVAGGRRPIGSSPSSFDRSSSALPPYDDSVKQIPCVCGHVVRGEDDDELWKNAQEHMREDHPDLAGKVSREDLLAQAEEIPKPKS